MRVVGRGSGTNRGIPMSRHRRSGRHEKTGERDDHSGSAATWLKHYLAANGNDGREGSALENYFETKKLMESGKSGRNGHTSTVLLAPREEGLQLAEALSAVAQSAEEKPDRDVIVEEMQDRLAKIGYEPIYGPDNEAPSVPAAAERLEVVGQALAAFNVSRSVLHAKSRKLRIHDPVFDELIRPLRNSMSAAQREGDFLRSTDGVERQKRINWETKLGKR